MSDATSADCIQHSSSSLCSSSSSSASSSSVAVPAVVTRTGGEAPVIPSSSHNPICFGCNKVIYERYLLQAMDEYWHEDCLKCSCCDCRLGEVGSSLFTKANLILCKRDYLRLFGSTGTCSACHKVIPAFELVMRARGSSVFHLDCFKCHAPECNHRFCVGDEFYMLDNRILCKFDYEEIMSSGKSALSCPPVSSPHHHNNTINLQTNGTPISPADRNGSTANWFNDSLDSLRRQTESIKTEIMNS